MIRHRELVPAAVVALLAVWAPWPFGSVTPGWAAVLQAGFALALALAAVFGGRLENDRAAPVPPGAGPPVRPLRRLRRIGVPVAGLMALALLGWLQSCTWPAAVAQTLSPEHARLRIEATAALEGEPVPPVPEGAPESPEAPSAVGPSADPPGVPLSLAPDVSRRTALHFACLAAALAAGALAGAARRGRRLVGAAVLLAALGQILYGAPRWLSGATTLYGLEVGASARLRGTFINPNHFAAYLEIALALAFAWGWWSLRRAAREPRPERKVGLIAAPAMVWATLFAGLAFTGSRAGVVAGVAGTLVQGLLVASSRGGGRRLRRALLALSGAVVAVGGLGLVLLIGAQAGLGRLATTSVYDLTWSIRRDVYRAALELWSRFPVTGTGLGTFVEAFPLVQPRDVPLVWRHAHSDPLELLVTAGLLGAVAALVGVVALVLRLIRVLRRGVRTEGRAGAVAALGALAALGLHECVDFGLTIPANAFTLAVLCGAAVSARLAPARPDRRRGTRPRSGGARG